MALSVSGWAVRYVLQWGSVPAKWFPVWSSSRGEVSFHFGPGAPALQAVPKALLFFRLRGGTQVKVHHRRRWWTLTSRPWPGRYLVRLAQQGWSTSGVTPGSYLHGRGLPVDFTRWPVALRSVQVNSPSELVRFGEQHLVRPRWV